MNGRVFLSVGKCFREHGAQFKREGGRCVDFSTLLFCASIILTSTLEAIPDITPLLQPTTLGDIATYGLFSAGGLFLGGETGLLTGTYSAKRAISRDPGTKARIETAFKKFRADVLKREVDRLNGGASVLDKIF